MSTTLEQADTVAGSTLTFRWPQDLLTSPHGIGCCVSACAGENLIGIELMSNDNDHRWDLREREDGCLPESDEAFDRKFEEWQARDWPDWLAKHLTFPFTVTREEDEDDAYFAPGAAKAPFRLGHKMDVLALAEEDVDQGMLVKVREKGKTGYVPLCDVEVTPKTDANFWPVREYVVWFANRC